MAWSTPVTQSSGHTVTATEWNNVQNNLLFLYGDSGWTAVGAFTNSWVAAGGTTPSYILLGRVVYLMGEISTGTLATAAFTLPSGYRPSVAMTFACSSGSTTVNQVTVNTSGTVVPATSTTTWLSNIAFPVV